jgi:hypothetical protein
MLGLSSSGMDAMHAEFLTKGEHLKVSLAAPTMLKALEEIEASRALFVRGDAAGGEQAALHALDLLGQIREAALAARPMRQEQKA